MTNHIRRLSLKRPANLANLANLATQPQTLYDPTCPLFLFRLDWGGGLDIEREGPYWTLDRVGPTSGPTMANLHFCPT